MSSGIYCIKNTINGKRYIGQSIDLNRRKICHFSLLNHNKHTNKHLQSSFNVYGKENFVFEVLILCKSFELTRYEQFFVDLIESKFSYNNYLECVNSPKGFKHSTETKILMSNQRQGGKHPLFGKHFSNESRKKMSESHMGKSKGTPSEETIKKISNSNRGKPKTEEQKMKLSIAVKGKPWTKNRRNAQERRKLCRLSDSL